MYNPLPKQLELRKSSIHGHGLFAKEHISKNTTLGISHVYHRLFPDGWIRTPLGGFYNHSENPNCELVDHDMDEGLISFTSTPCFSITSKLLRTIKNISVGTELTCTYTIWQATPEMKSTREDWLGL